MSEAWIAIISGGLGAGLLALVQFLISHFTESKTHKEERKENVSNLRTELKQHLEDVNEEWKEKYCDKNAAAIDELREAVLALTKDAEERRKYEKAMGESLLALTHDKIVHLGHKYQRRKGITLSEQTNLKMLYEPYHALGGNHDGDTWYNYCMKELPVITEKEAIELDNSK